MTAPDLLPCPFCGYEPDGYEGNRVSCRCGAMGPHEVAGDPESPTWSTRADLATPAAMTPEVRALVEAAEPLAAMASRYDPEDGDGDLECWSGLAVPKIKHIRALRAALAALRERCDA